MKISVVIPTYNRPKQLSAVIDKVLESETNGIELIEVIVVDNGSVLRSEPVVAEKQSRPPFTLQYVWQENSGPAAARNHGFRIASGEIVLCVDDDILFESDAIKWHIKAHIERPCSVICGQCPIADSGDAGFAYAYLNGLQPEYTQTLGPIRQHIIASGQISFEKKQFAGDGPYRSDLRTPAAEEYELSYRLAKMDVPICVEPRARGLHLVSGTIRDKSIQEFKYGVVIGECYFKVPELREFEPYRLLYETNCNIQPGKDSLQLMAKKFLKSLNGPETLRKALIAGGELICKSPLPKAVKISTLRWIFGVNLQVGVREGIRRFSSAYTKRK
jgi:glycosyltransferase involved in cell wall biosynthesis